MCVWILFLFWWIDTSAFTILPVQPCRNSPILANQSMLGNPPCTRQPCLQSPLQQKMAVPAQQFVFSELPPSAGGVQVLGPAVQSAIPATTPAAIPATVVTQPVQTAMRERFPFNNAAYTIPPPAPVINLVSSQRPQPVSSYAPKVQYIAPNQLGGYMQQSKPDEQWMSEYEEQMRDREEALSEKLRQLRSEQSKLQSERKHNQEVKLALLEEQGKLVEAQAELARQKKEQEQESNKSKAATILNLLKQRQEQKSLLNSKVQQNRQDYNAELHRYRESKREHDATMASSQAEKSILEQKINRTEMSIVDLNKRIGDFQLKLEEAKKSLNERESTNAAAKNQLTDLDRQIGEQKRNIQERNEQLVRLKAQAKSEDDKLKRIGKQPLEESGGFPVELNG